MWFHPRWWTGPEQSLDYVVTDLVVPLSDKTKATDRSARWSSRVISHQRRIRLGKTFTSDCARVCVCVCVSIQVLVFEFQISWIFAALNVSRKGNKWVRSSNSNRIYQKRICLLIPYYVFGLLNFLNIFPRYFLNSTILIANESFPIFHILILIILVAFFVVLQFFLFLNFSRKGPIFVERSD